MYQRKDGDGSLFQNQKQKDSHPDYRGTVQLDGKEYEIAGWKKSTKDGKPWLSLKVQPKRAKPDDRRPERGSFDKHNLGTSIEERQAAAAGGFEDDIPFAAAYVNTQP